MVHTFDVWGKVVLHGGRMEWGVVKARGTLSNQGGFIADDGVKVVEHTEMRNERLVGMALRNVDLYGCELINCTILKADLPCTAA
eukprot:gene49551-51921_t